MRSTATWITRQPIGLFATLLLPSGILVDCIPTLSTVSLEPELPAHRVPLTRAQVERKRAAIREHQIPTVHDALIQHAKDEEIFWLSSASDTQK